MPRVKTAFEAWYGNQLQTVPNVTRTCRYTFREEDFFQPDDEPDKESLKRTGKYKYPNWVIAQLNPPAEGTEEREGHVYSCVKCGKGAEVNRNNCSQTCFDNYNDSMNRFEKRIELRHVDGKSIGVFLKAGESPIPVGKTVGIYFGRLIPYSLDTVWDNSDYCLPAGGVQVEGALMIDSQHEGNWTRFINSACEPNLEVVGEQAGRIRIMKFETSKVIQPGDELTFFYGRGYFTERGMDCRCSSHPEPYPTINDTPDPLEDDEETDMDSSDEEETPPRGKRPREDTDDEEEKPPKQKRKTKCHVKSPVPSLFKGKR